MSAFVVFEVASQRWALPAADVDQVLRMAALAPFRGPDPSVEGLLDLRGELVPVVAARARLGVDARPASPEDYLVIVRGPSGRVAIRVDRVVAVVDAEVPLAPGGARSGAEAVAGAVRLPDGLALVPRTGPAFFTDPPAAT